MKNKFLLIVALFLLSTFAGIAQSKYIVSGFVRDSLSAEPLVGVTVSSSSTNGVYTNEYGFFSFTVSGEDVNLSFSSIGYQPKQYKNKLNKDLELEILLRQSILTLNEVIIEAEQSRMVATRALGSYAINSQQLNYVPSFLGEKDVFKYFQILPGVNSGKDGSSGMNLRGGSTDQTLILMDDIPIYNSAHAFGMISIFSGDYIKSAELYKGYVPSQYGGRLSGVATMNIREGNRNEHEQQLQIGTTTASAIFEGPINGGKGSYLVGGRYFVPNLFLNALPLFMDKEDSAYPLLGFYDATAKVSYDISKNSTIYGSFYTGRDALNFISNDTGAGADGYTQPTNSESGINWGNMVGSVRLSSKLSNKSFLNVTTYYSHLSNSRVNIYNGTDGKSLVSDISSQMNEVGLKANVKHNVSNWYDLNYGLNLSHQHFIPQDVSINRDGIITDTEYGSRTLYNVNMYLDNKFQFNDFIFNVGGRMAWYNNNLENKVVLEPRTALTYYMPKSSAWVSYTVNSQPLFSMNQMVSSIPLDYWVPFNSSDELPTNQQLSLGYKHSFGFGLELQAETYYKKSKNLSIVYNTDDFLLDDGGYTLGTGDAYGAELLMQYSYKRLNVMASYTYSKSVHHIDGKTVDFIYDTPHNLNIFASYDVLRKGAKTHTVSVNANYKTGMPYIMSNSVFPMNGSFDSWFDNLVNYPMYANSRLTNFFRLDLNYTMEKKLKNGSRIWQISLLNATAHRNPYIVYYDDNKYKAFQLIPFLPSFSYTRKF